MDNITAYSYIRFSSVKQELGDSLRRQTELSDAYVKTHALTLDTSLTLKDLGVSAFKKANAESGALRVFLDAIKSGKVKQGSMLLVESLDRISRATTMEALEIFTSIINSGITIVTLADNHVYSKDSIKDNWTQLIISISIMARAHEESAMKSKRIKASWDNRKKNPTKKITGRCPAWMTISEDKSKFILKPNASKILKRILKMSYDGVGTNTIAQRLTKEKVPMFTKGNIWNNGTIQKIIIHTALYGEANFKDSEPIPNYYPAIVTKEEWLKVQQARTSRHHGGGGRRANNVTSLFSGLLKCGYCGESMRISGYTNPTNKVHHKYYVCAKGNEGRGCVTIQWPTKDFEQMVLSYLSELNVNEILEESSNQSALAGMYEKREEISVNLTEIKRKLTNLVNSIASGEAPKSVIEAISKLEETSLGLNSDLQTLNKLIEQELSSDSVLVEQQKSLAQLNSLLSQKSGIELLDIRLRLQEQIRRIVKVVRVKAGGHFNNIGRDIEFKKYRYVELEFRNKNVVRVISLNKVFEKE